ncbi:DNA polymerase III subunit beta [Bifidobacterium felsineum]|uniref:DNA polymerase III subunit beta n=1 Tax=Bifidobacterium felsineum TaxID=2045440 RepID=UPI001C2F9F4B|nr:DNA polymerase III subunit beta [Bifidobacterium felsineum]
MRILVDAKELSEAVAHVARVLDPDRPGILLDAGEEGLTVSASGDSQWSRAVIQGDPIENGRTTVNGLWLDALARVMPAGEINVETHDTYLQLRGGQASLRMRVAADDLTPDQPTLPDTIHDVDAAGFEALCKSVTGAAGATRDQPVLAAVNLTSRDSVLTACATNRYMAARRTLDTPGLPDGTWLADADWLKRNMRGVTGIGFTDRMMLIRTDRWTDMITLVDGTYPDLDRLWTQDGEHGTITVDRQRLLDAARMLRTVCFDRTPGTIPIGLDEHENMLRARYLGGGLDGDSMGVRMLDADLEGDVHVNLNADYLIAALQAMDAPQVTFHVNGLHPTLITQDDAVVDQLIVPVRGVRES